MPPSSFPRAAPDDPLVLIGALHVDELYWPSAPLVLRASNPMRRARRVGGVAANVARAARTVPENPKVSATSAPRASRAAHRRATARAYPARSAPTPPRPVILSAALGDDPDGRWLVETLLAAGVDCRAVTVPGRSSGRYGVVHDEAGELLVGLSDVDVAEALDATSVRARLADTRAAAVVLDANLSERCLAAFLARDDGSPAPWRDAPRVALAVSPAKAVRFTPHLASLDLLYCNRREAAALGHVDEEAPIDSLADALVAAGVSRFVLSDGGASVLVHDPDDRRTVPVPPVTIAGSVNGAGDALAGASLAHWLAHGDLAAAVAEAGIPAARAVLRAGTEL